MIFLASDVEHIARIAAAERARHGPLTVKEIIRLALVHAPTLTPVPVTSSKGEKMEQIKNMAAR
jgi:hypothetical protein